MLTLTESPLFKKYNIKGYFSQKVPKNYVVTLSRLFLPKQIHSDFLIEIEYPIPPFSKEGDGAITLLKDFTLAIQSADCLPILIADKGKNIIAAVHAGWRGTLKGILYKAIKIILNKGIEKEDILIAIGPHIQAPCYEVGEEILDVLDRNFKKPPYLTLKNGKYFLNLALMNLFQAVELNIKEEQIWISKECTHCLSDKYHSFRREKNLAFTQLAIISL